MAGVLMAHSGPIAAGNSWGCPPSMCTRKLKSSASSSVHLSLVAGCLLLARATPVCTKPRLRGLKCTRAAFTTAPDAFSSSSSPGSAGQHQNQQQQQHQQQLLLPFPAGLPDPQLQRLCQVLNLPAASAQLILLSCPDVSTLPTAQLAANWQQLQQLLPLPQQLLLQAVLQLPSLLPQPQQTVTARLSEAAEVLGLPVGRLRSSRRQQTTQLHWRLLVTPREQLEQQLVQLVQLLGGLQQQQVVILLCAEPRLLTTDAAQLLSTVEALEQVCGCQLARLFPQLRSETSLLVTSADSLYRAAAALQQLLRLSEEGLTLVVRRATGALVVPPTNLTDLLCQLPAALAVSTEVAADILLQEPELLLRSPDAILAVLSVLRSRYRLSSDALLQVVEFDPSILLLSPGQLAEETKQFKLLAASHPMWAAEYKSLMSRPVNVARALRIEPLRLQRLVFLSRQGLAGTISLRNALTLSGRKFMGLYPRYRAWLAHAYSRGNPPKRYAAPPGASLEEDSEDDSD